MGIFISLHMKWNCLSRGGCLYTCYMGVKDAIVRRHYYAGE
ncbi:hypothetical protein V6Z12_D01G079800 [Gossypium hirsutum]